MENRERVIIGGLYVSGVSVLASFVVTATALIMGHTEISGLLWAFYYSMIAGAISGAATSVGVAMSTKKTQ